MPRVRQVTGPANAAVGDAVTYTASAFDPPVITDAEAAGIHWLVKSSDGSALLHRRDVGRALSLVVPEAWSGHTVAVMPYFNSPSTMVSVTTTIAASAPAAGGPKSVRIVRDGKRIYASVDGEPRFYLGSDVAYLGRRGLMNTANPPGPRYQPADWQAAHGDWAWYLLPTITAESRGAFTCLNTYDRAAFTFGHLQYAAHTPDDNFVVLLRQLLALPLAASYFPDLAVVAGRVVRKQDGVSKPLESAASTAALMAYLNATATKVDDAEAERAARFVDWCLRDPAARAAMVDYGVRQQRHRLAETARNVPLDGVVDKLCLVVLDVRHQGRGGYASLRAALAAADPLDALLSIGAAKYPERVSTVRTVLRDLEAAGRVGGKVYGRAAGDFVEPDGV